MLLVEKKPFCLICNYSMHFLLKGKDFLYYTTDKLFDVYRCPHCRLEMIYPLPSVEEIFSFYPKHYYSYSISEEKSFFHRLRQKVVDRAYNKNTSRDFYFFVALLAKNIFEGLPLKKIGACRFLDVGCGDGYNLRLIEKYGWHTSGFEFGPVDRKGNIYYDQDITSVRFDGDRFDYIRVWHVLEHVRSPDLLITTLNTLLSSQGILVIGIPNTGSLYARIFRRYWYNRDIPRHIFNYNLQNLRQLLEKYGLRVMRVKYMSAGGCLGSLQHFINSKLGKKYNLINKTFFFLLFYPLDIISNLLKLGDCVSVTVQKN